MITRDEVLELLATSFNRFLFDNFQSTEQINNAVTGTGEVVPNLLDMTLDTGMQANSTAKIYYAMNWFNPVYSKLYLRLYAKSISDVFAFIGFKESLSDPTSTMTESHAGLMIYNSKLYFSTGRKLIVNGNLVQGQQKTEITGMDITKDFIYKIENNKLSTQPLPQRIPYFDGFRIITPDRIFSLRAENGTFPPLDEVHYLTAFIKNTTGTGRFIKIKTLTYGEEYAD